MSKDLLIKLRHKKEMYSEQRDVACKNTWMPYGHTEMESGKLRCRWK